MPNNIVKSYAKKTGKSVQDVEKEWNKAKAIAAEEGHKEDYPYIVGILKKMLSINEESNRQTFRSFYEDMINSSEE